jgi:hypothetical protein
MKRILYLAYYLKNLDWKRLWQFADYVKARTRDSIIRQLITIKYHVFKYNISILEYYQFRFFEKSHKEKLTWAGTGFMYEYQLKMNPKSERHILDDKRLFAKEYRDFLVHQVEDLESLKSQPEKVEKLLSNPSGKIVFKAADGKCGAQVLIEPASNFNYDKLIQFLENSEYDLVEEFIIQHPALQQLSPSAVNTIRIFTQLNAQNEVDLLGCRLRISVNSPVDNMAAGNLAAPINEYTGKVEGPGVYSDITKLDEKVHPVTDIPILGFQVPYWQECIEMVKKAALAHPQNRSIGWDVVITENGPGLIEGNHDWCKLLWQLPVKQGLKKVLLKYT